MRLIALDTNLLVLLVVGIVAPNMIVRHKRLGGYSAADFKLLRETIARAKSLVVTPNALTEASNVVTYGLSDPLRSQIATSLASIVARADERFESSRLVVLDADYGRLGIADCAWLRCLDRETPLLTDDVQLYLAALSRGFEAYNFNHLRERRGTV